MTVTVSSKTLTHRVHAVVLREVTDVAKITITRENVAMAFPKYEINIHIIATEIYFSYISYTACNLYQLTLFITRYTYVLYCIIYSSSVNSKSSIDDGRHTIHAPAINHRA